MDFASMTMLIGFFGGAAVLAGFAGVASGRMTAHGPRYHSLNLAGGLALVAAGVSAEAWPSVLVNATWALISAHGLTHAVGCDRSTHEPERPIVLRSPTAPRPDTSQ